MNILGTTARIHLNTSTSDCPPSTSITSDTTVIVGAIDSWNACCEGFVRAVREVARVLDEFNDATTEPEPEDPPPRPEWLDHRPARRSNRLMVRRARITRRRRRTMLARLQPRFRLSRAELRARPVDQLAESAVSKTVRCGFKPRRADLKCEHPHCSRPYAKGPQTRPGSVRVEFGRVRGVSRLHHVSDVDWVALSPLVTPKAGRQPAGHE